MPDLAFHAASKRFAGRVVLGPIEFSIEGPGVTGLVGPNGAGKTTTLRLAAGYFSPSSGSVETAGGPAPHDSPELRAAIGYLPERPPLYPELSVEEQLMLAGRLKRVENSALRLRVSETARKCGLGAVLSQRTSALSAGYRQRTGLAAALMGLAPLVLLDEPTSHLDPLQRQETLEMIALEGQARSIVLSTHRLSEVEAICSRVLVLQKGKLVADGPPAALRGAVSAVRLRVRGPAAAIMAALEPAFGVGAVRLMGEAEGVSAFEIAASGAASSAARIVLEGGWELLELTGASAGIEALLRENRD